MKKKRNSNNDSNRDFNDKNDNNINNLMALPTHFNNSVLPWSEFSCSGVLTRHVYTKLPANFK
jgi:hypothetical protein